MTRPRCPKCHRAISKNPDNLICSICHSTVHRACVDQSLIPSLASAFICCTFAPQTVIEATVDTVESANQSVTPQKSKSKGKRQITPPSPPTGKVARVMEYQGAPAWFTQYVDEFRDFRQGHEQSIAALSSRIGEIEKQVSRIDKHDEKINTNSSEIVALQEEISNLKKSLKGELTITGVPAQVKLNPREIAERLATALGVPHLIPSILDAREMTRAPQVQPVGDLASATSSTNQILPTFRSVAVLMYSSTVRDVFVSKRSALKTLKSQAIFGTGGDASIFIKEMWPQPVYDLWRKTNIARKKLNYFRAYVRDLNVYILETRTSRPIRISKESDLSSLVPHTQPME
ncbi:hypothetical protein QAD02_000841 [Eretmocerus hayati]|uniref:Uncharacterized protein n=1 Tax=Eretmocerus hayati TaxID=131215 RepID=A0ACC2NH68_9HYME|nr:hypothetical protein QAD02_000841 [Eretmocerus hayati]